LRKKRDNGQTFYFRKEAGLMLKESGLEVNVGLIRGKLEDLITFVSTAAEKGTAAHEVERGLFRSLLELGKLRFGLFLLSVGEGDVGESVTLDHGRTLHRHKALNRRRLLMAFGEFFLNRQVYSERSHAAIELIPADQRLPLPESEVSYLLQGWDQMFGVEMAFGKTRDMIESLLGIRQSVDTLEGGSRAMAEAADDFSLNCRPWIAKQKAVCRSSRKTTKAFRWCGPRRNRHRLAG